MIITLARRFGAIHDEAYYINLPLTFQTVGTCTFGFTKYGSGTLRYRIGNGSWITLGNTSTVTVTGRKSISWSGNLTVGRSTVGNYQGLGNFTSSGEFYALGNPLSLKFSNYPNVTDLTGNSYIFSNLFANNEGLRSAYNLYLPATTLSTFCYALMFYNCPALEIAPTLPAPTLVTGCYTYMFYGCSFLRYIKMLTEEIDYSCTSRWVNGVGSTGTFIKKDSTNIDYGVNGIPDGWNVIGV